MITTDTDRRVNDDGDDESITHHETTTFDEESPSADSNIINEAVKLADYPLLLPACRTGGLLRVQDCVGVIRTVLCAFRLNRGRIITGMDEDFLRLTPKFKFKTQIATSRSRSRT